MRNKKGKEEEEKAKKKKGTMKRNTESASLQVCKPFQAELLKFQFPKAPTPL